MNLPYDTILKELKDGPRTLEELQVIDKEGDTAESVTCLVARGLIKYIGGGLYARDEEALQREASFHG